MKDILIICPVLGRPEGVKLLIESISETTSICDLSFWYTDSDTEKEQVLKAIGEYSKYTVPGIEPPNMIYGVNYVYRQERPHKYYTLGNNDVEFKTKDWDVQLASGLEEYCKELGHRYCFVYGEDGINGERLPTMPMFTREFCEAIGGILPNFSKHLYSDNALLDIGKSLNICKYLPNVNMSFTHPMHPNPDKRREWDRVYEITNSKKRYNEDCNLYIKWKLERLGPLLSSIQRKIIAEVKGK